MNFYYGIDIGVILSAYSIESNSQYFESVSRDKTDFFIGPAIGGEYMFNDSFSLGAEIQINYISVGQYDDDSQDVSQSLISTRGLITLRWYVN